jgi:tRNA(Leu) C34 or U34 (ribose-2'-O)-methylase TrmL
MISVVLINPKYDYNVGGALRACSCWGASTLRWTGDRVRFDRNDKARIPREERMKGYTDVDFARTQRPLDGLDGTPVVVELREHAECLTLFEHPEDAIYIFGPEDGSVPKGYLHLAHRFVFIPTHHCLNLSAAVNVVLGHRRFSRQLAGVEEITTVAEMLREHRGFCEPDFVGWECR